MTRTTTTAMDIEDRIATTNATVMVHNHIVTKRETEEMVILPLLLLLLLHLHLLQSLDPPANKMATIITKMAKAKEDCAPTVGTQAMAKVIATGWMKTRPTELRPNHAPMPIGKGRRRAFLGRPGRSQRRIVCQNTSLLFVVLFN